MDRIYLDSSAHTPVCDEVKQFLRSFDYSKLANPSSLHKDGAYCKKLIEDTREKMATLLRCDKDELVFTSGASEGASLALNVWYTDRFKVGALSVSPYEHKCIAENPCCFYDYELKKEPPEIQMSVNNETGQLFDVEDAYLCDITSSIGNTHISLNELDTVTAIASSEKFGGLSGSGFLYVSKKHNPLIKPLIYGTQERGIRGGTENTIGIVCMGIALEQSVRDIDLKRKKCIDFTQKIKSILNFNKIDYIHNRGALNIPSILNLSFRGVDGSAMATWLDANGISVSTGSACHSGSEKPSNTLVAMRVPPDYINGTLRISFNAHNTIEEVTHTALKIVEFVNKFKV